MTPYVGEIRMVAFNFAPFGWLPCLGQMLPIGDYQALYSLFGTTYGGDGVNTFALPDLRGRVPVHQAASLVLGQTGGAETVVLTAAQMPAHNHPAIGTSAAGTQTSPAGATWAADAGARQFAPAASATAAMGAGSLGATGGGQAHENMPPFTVLTFIIAVDGIYPTPA